MVSKRSFVSVFSSLSIVGGVLAIAPSAFAACPAADPGTLTAKPAKAISSACVQADIDALNAFVDAATDTTTWAELEAAMTTQHAACATCAFSAQADANWGPLVKMSSGGVMVNKGACLEKASGGSATCGATYQKAQLCASARCGSGSTCSTEAEQNTCLNTAFGDAASCGKYDIDTDCPNWDALTDEDPNNLGPCVDYVAMIATLCSAPGTVDAGPGPGPGPGPGVDAGPQPPKKDAGPGTKKDASPQTGDDDDDDDDDDTSGDDDDDSTSKPSTTKKDAGKKTNAAEDDDTGSASESGCAQSGSTSGGSVASALGLMFVVGSVLRARRRSKR